MPQSSVSASSTSFQNALWLALSASAGAALATWFHRRHTSKMIENKKAAAADPETDPSVGHDLVWQTIGGAMNAAMLYTGDRLGLYAVLREACNSNSGKKKSQSQQQASSSSFVTAETLAEQTGLNQRWLREWLANQAAMGVLTLLPGDGNDDADLHYRLPNATAEVLANPDSKEYDISLIQMVPTLVNRAKTMLPEAFATGIGRPYDDPEISEAIDRHHRKHIRDIFIPEVLPKAPQQVLEQLKAGGCQVADLGCGAGIMLISLAQAFPNATFHGYEVSEAALTKAAHNVAAAKVTNVFLHNANHPGESLGDKKDFFDLCIVYDVLHDCTQPADLIRQVKVSLKQPQQQQKRGLWLLADIPAAPTIRENIKVMPNPATYFAMSTCLCMSCSLSEKGGAGLGTLGFSVPVAKKMLLTDGGFDSVDVLLEKDNARWFLVK